MQRIVRAVPRPPSTVVLAFEGGAKVDVDVAPFIWMGRVYAALADTTLFAQVRIGERGRWIEWPGELDFCADALWRAGEGRETLAS